MLPRADVQAIFGAGAEREALSLLEDCVGTEHILLGMLRVGDGTAVQILLDFELDRERIRQDVLHTLLGRVRPGPR